MAVIATMALILTILLSSTAPLDHWIAITDNGALVTIVTIVTIVTNIANVTCQMRTNYSIIAWA